MALERITLRIRRSFRAHAFHGGAYLPAGEVSAADGPLEYIAPSAKVVVPLLQHVGSPADALVEVGQAVRIGELIGKASQAGAMAIHSPVAGTVVGLVRAVSASHVDVAAVEIECGEKNSSSPLDIEGTFPLANEATSILNDEATSILGNEAKRSSPPLDNGGQQQSPPLNKGGEGGVNAARESSSVKESPLAPPFKGGNVDELAEIADRAGIVSCRRAAAALGEQLRAAGRGTITDVIISGLPQEPLVTAGCELLRRHAKETVDMGMQLADALEAKRIWLAVDRGDRDLVGRCRRAVRKTSVRVAPLHNKYPQAAPVLLAWAIAGRETPIGRRPEDVGCFIVEVEALLALAEAIHTGRPMIERVVNVGGPAIARPGVYRIPVGVTVADVLRHVGLARRVAQMIEGGPLTGRTIETTEAVVTRQTSALLALDHESERVPAPGPCIRCGWCQDGCPVGLDPQALLDAAERGDIKAARSLHPGACLACGLCSYVCPAELPLSQAATRLRYLGSQGS